MVWVREVNVRGPQGPSGGIDPDDPVMAASVQAAVNARLQAENIMRAYPEEPLLYTGFDAIPMRWTYKVLDAPVPELVTETVEGTWTGENQRRGDVLVLDESGKINADRIPGSIARMGDIPDVSEIEEIVSGMRQTELRVRPELPVFAARLAAARTRGEPLAIGIGSSSTFARNPGPGARLLEMVQSAWLVPSQSAMQWSSTATFTPIIRPGIHAYNAGVGGTRSSDYMPVEKRDKFIALGIAVMFHIVGANDYTDQVDPAVYRANIEAVIDDIDARSALPVQHILVHAYARKAFTPSTYPNSAYRDALQAIAAARDNVGFIDYSHNFEVLGVPGDDPLDLVGPDNIHPTDDGNELIATTVAHGTVG